MSKQASVPWTRDELLRQLKAPDSGDRERAAQMLGTFYLDDPSIVGPLVEALSDPASGVRRSAADSLGRVIRIAKVSDIGSRGTQRLLTLLDDENEEVVASAIDALGQLGDDSVGPRILSFLDYPDLPHVRIRSVAVEALYALRYQPAVPHFQRLLRDPNPSVRNDALFALFGLRHVDATVDEILRSLVDDPNSPLGDRARSMLEVIAEEKESD
jgi:HEAT repeat protein